MSTTLALNNYSEKGIYDPVQKCIKTTKYIKKIYGNKIFLQLIKETDEARQFRRCHPDEAYSKDLTDTMKETCINQFSWFGFEVEKEFNEKAKNDFRSCLGFYFESQSDKIKKNLDPETNIQRQRQKGDDFFMMLERGLFLNPEFRKIFKGPFTVYAWIWSNIVRKGWIDKKGYPIKKRYYDRGLLAYCSSYSKIAKECFMDKDTVKKYIDYLESKDIIKVDFIVPEGRKLKQGVYILGEWMKIEGVITEKLYMNKVLLSEKEGSLWDIEL